MTVQVGVHDRIATVRIASGRPFNALDATTMRDLEQAWNDVDGDDEVRVVVLAGGEDVFSAGGDLKTVIDDVLDGNADWMVGPASRTYLKVGLTKPLVGAVRGLCLGGGFELMLACDVRVASTSATFGLPEVRWGLYPGGGGPYRLCRQLPRAIAMELLLTGGTITAADALRFGLVNRVTEPEDVEACALDLARRIAECGPIATRAVKAATVQGDGLSASEAYELEARLARAVSSSEDARIGVAAFRDKVPPAFGRQGSES